MEVQALLLLHLPFALWGDRMNVSESCLESRPRNAVVTAIFGQMFATLAHLYCRCFHRGISRPVNGKYRCWTCLREFEIGW
jgi:hypothetical protein